MFWLEEGTCHNGPRTDFGCVLADEKIIFLIGGKEGLNGLDRVDVWNALTNKWFSAPRLPIKMKYCRAVLLNRFIYVAGTYKEFYRMNIDNMRGGWQRLPSLKVDGLGCQLVTDRNTYIYRVGGNMSNKKSMHRYNTKNNYWERLPSITEERDLAAATLVNNKIYVMGGRTGFSGDDVLSSMSIFDISKMEWSMGPQLPRKMYGHAVVAISDSCLFVCGGQKHHGCPRFMTSCFLFNIEQNEWHKLLHTPLPQGLSGHSIVAQGRSVFALGGQSGCIDDYENKTDRPIYKLLYKNPSLVSCSMSIDSSHHSYFSFKSTESKSLKGMKGLKSLFRSQISTQTVVSTLSCSSSAHSSH